MEGERCLFGIIKKISDMRGKQFYDQDFVLSLISHPSRMFLPSHFSKTKCWGSFLPSPAHIPFPFSLYMTIPESHFKKYIYITLLFFPVAINNVGS